LTNARVCPSKLCWLVPSTKRNRKTSNCVRSLTDDAITATRTHRAPEHTNEKTTTRDGWVAVVQFGGVGCERGDPEERCCGSWHFSLSPNTHTHTRTGAHTRTYAGWYSLCWTFCLGKQVDSVIVRLHANLPEVVRESFFQRELVGLVNWVCHGWRHPSRFWNFTTENSLT
jgi:hypothetical protein